MLHAAQSQLITTAKEDVKVYCFDSNEVVDP